jgi:hypothetical protein
VFAPGSDFIGIEEISREFQLSGAHLLAAQSNLADESRIRHQVRFRSSNMRADIVIAAIAFASCISGGTCSAQEPSGELSVSSDVAHQVTATVTGKVARCGLTALAEAPSVRRSGQVVEVTQPVAGVACLADVPPGAVRPYHVTVSLGELPPGEYTVNWNFPKLTATYTVSQ